MNAFEPMRTRLVEWLVAAAYPLWSRNGIDQPQRRVYRGARRERTWPSYSLVGPGYSRARSTHLAGRAHSAGAAT